MPQTKEEFKQSIEDCRNLITQGRLSEAEELLESLTEWAATQKEKDPEPAIDCENEIARIAIRRGDAAKAIAITQAILDQIKETRLHYPFGKGVALETLGASHTQRGDSEKADTCYNEALSIWKDIKNQDHIARCLNNLAIIDTTIGKPVEALKRYEEALKIWTNLDDPTGKSACYNNIAILKHNAGDLPGAVRGYRQALEEAKRIGDDYMAATALDNLGWVHAALDAPEQALECLQDAETLFNPENDPGLDIDIAYGKALVLADIKRYEEAEHALAIGLNAAQRLDSKPLQIAGQFFEGYLNLSQHNLKPAKITLESTLEQAKEIGLVEYILRALVHLIEIDLLEYRTTFDERYLETMQERITEAYEQATRHQQVLELVQIAILEALLAAANMELEKAIKGMEFVIQLTEERHLPQQAKKAERHLHRLQEIKKKAEKHLMEGMETEKVDEMLEEVRGVEKQLRSKGA
ncbi:MAG: tetratricopeptide repeat protein [Candidatus Hodarchaeota archaeon]